MAIIGVYHTYNGEIHKGPSANCRTCKRQKKMKPKDFSAMGKVGGKIAAAGRKRHCKCGKEIGRTNKTGKCVKCYREWARKKYTKPASKEQKKCANCGKLLDKRNKSGYCVKHYSESENYKQQVKQHAEWSTVGVFCKDMKEAPKKSAVSKQNSSEASVTNVPT